MEASGCCSPRWRISSSPWRRNASFVSTENLFRSRSNLRSFLSPKNVFSSRRSILFPHKDSSLRFEQPLKNPMGILEIWFPQRYRYLSCVISEREDPPAESSVHNRQDATPGKHVFQSSESPASNVMTNRIKVQHNFLNFLDGERSRKVRW